MQSQPAINKSSQNILMLKVFPFGKDLGWAALPSRS